MTETANDDQTVASDSVEDAFLNLLISLGSRAEQRLHGRPPTHSHETKMHETKMEVVHLNQKQLATCWNISETCLERSPGEGVGANFMELRGRVLYRQVDKARRSTK